MGGKHSKAQEKYLCLQLHNAVIDGNEDVVRELLLCGAVSPNSKLFTQSRKLDHPLFTAVENHCLQLVEVLLEYGASTSAANKEGNTPLHLAASDNLLQIAEVLLRHNADCSAVNARGETPLHMASTYGMVNMASLLINSGAPVNFRNKQQRTPLHAACAITANNDMITTLLNSGVNLDATDDDQRVALHYLAQLGKTQGIDILLQAGASINACDAYGKSALHFAVENQEMQAARMLLRHGCDVNVQDNAGHTPLHKAVEKEYSELVSTLIQNGADPNLPSSSGRFPLRIAVWKKNFDIAQKLLLNAGAQVNVCDRTGITPLHVACLYALKESDEDMQLIEMLIGSGADVNARCTKHGRSPLHNAVEAKNDESVMLLLRAGADPDLTDNKGKSPRSICTHPYISALFNNVTTYSHGNLTLNSSCERTPALSREVNTPPDPTNSMSRSVNLYTPPTARLRPDENVETNSGDTPPPIPPRDEPFQPAMASNGPDLPVSPPLFSATNVIRHNFVWSSLECEAKPASDNSARRLKIDSSMLPKLLSFPTSFGDGNPEPSMFCYSVTKTGQLLDTKLGCILSIDANSVVSTLLLYVQALDYSSDILPLPSFYRLCSNLIHFYSHCSSMGFRSGRPLHHNALPEKEVPHLINPVLVQFPLKRSAYSMFDAHENEFKLLVSYDEGLTWEEIASKLEKICLEDGSSDFIHVLVAETDELGMYAVVLGPRRDVKRNVNHGDKVVSSVDHGVNLSVSIGHNEACTVEMTAECVQPILLEKLHNQGFAYVLSCSRIVSLLITNNNDNGNVTVSLNLPISISHSSTHGDVSYRVIKKSADSIQKGWQCCAKASWKDVTQKECQNLQASTKGKRLLGSINSSSPPHVSFDITLDTCKKHFFLVTAVRSFTRSLSHHLVQIPEHIERIKASSSLCFLVHHKATRLSDVTCDVIPAKDVDIIEQAYLDNGSFMGPPPSASQVVQERDSITISLSGGLKLLNRNSIKSRKLVFHSGLLPFSEKLKIKGTSHDQNTTADYVGAVNFHVTSDADGVSLGTRPSVSGPRSALSSESSVLVMENRAFSPEASLASVSQTFETNVTASLPLQLPRKHHLKINKPTPSSDIDNNQLSKHVVELVCKRLDRMEFHELGFQLGISKQRIDDAFAQHPDNSQTAAFEVLDQWNADKTSLNQDAVPQLCGALSCIGRENLSQNVARQCNPFVLEELSGLAPLPEHIGLTESNVSPV